MTATARLLCGHVRTTVVMDALHSARASFQRVIREKFILVLSERREANFHAEEGCLPAAGSSGTEMHGGFDYKTTANCK